MAVPAYAITNATRRRAWIAALLAVVLAGLFVLAAGCRRREPVIVRYAAPYAVNAPRSCSPPCSPGFMCHGGMCVPVCNPICPVGWACTPQGCVPVCNPPCNEGYQCDANRTCQPRWVSVPSTAAASDPSQEWREPPPAPSESD